MSVLYIFNDSAPTDIYTLSLHDALPIFPSFVSGAMAKAGKGLLEGTLQAGTSAVSDKYLQEVLYQRSEERFSRNAETDVVCRLLVDQKKGRLSRYAVVH